MVMLMQLWRLQYVRDGITLGNLCLCLPIKMASFLWQLSCVQSCTLHGSETWLVNKENKMASQQAETRMIR